MKLDINNRYRTADGRKAKIIADNIFIVQINDHDTYRYREDGVRLDIYGNPAYDPNGHDQLVEVNPYTDFNIDDPIMVSNSLESIGSVENEDVYVGHFAGVNENGFPTIFLNGKTSFTIGTNFSRIPFRYAKKIEKRNVESKNNEK
jgi:hypothetical protein